MRQKKNSYFSFANERRQKTQSSGFTLVELMVVLAIIGVVMSIVLTNQGSFNKTLILQNTTYDIALTLRNAETYGLGSRAVGLAANLGYGVHFQNAPARLMTLFADTSPSPDASNCHGLPAGGADAPDAQPGDCVYT
ncbi:MAG: type II secretion system protein, partial [bacterium]|nr:type II secretion system protein [bacterium]